MTGAILIPLGQAALVVLAIVAAYKIGYGAAISDVGRTLADVREVANAEIEAANKRAETPFDWDDTPLVELAVMRGADLRALENEMTTGIAEWEDRHAGTRYEG